VNVLCDPVQYKRNEKVHGRLATPFVKLQTNAAVLQNLMRQWLNTLKISHNAVLAHICISVGQNVIIQAIHVNYTSWYGKLSENYGESKK